VTFAVRGPFIVGLVATAMGCASVAVDAAAAEDRRWDGERGVVLFRSGSCALFGARKDAGCQLLVSSEREAESDAGLYVPLTSDAPLFVECPTTREVCGVKVRCDCVLERP
jgi:hypothetical protein